MAVTLWASLARYAGPPGVLLQRCRDRIERDSGAQRANLLAVAQVFARLHLDRPEWLDILGGTKAMIESPLIQEIVEESRREGRVEAILDILQGKFGPVGPTITAGLAQVKETEKLRGLSLHSATCATLEDFEQRLLTELPQPAPVSTRGKRRPRKSPE